MGCFNPKVKVRRANRDAANMHTVVKRRQTLAANSVMTLGIKTRCIRARRTSTSVEGTSEWANAGRKLAAQLDNTALQVRLMPPDGNCFYHAVADRLRLLGHAYTAEELKQRAGAGHGDEAEDCHIRALVMAPVPLRLKLVPVDADEDPFSLNWDAAEDLGDVGAPTLNLVHWRRRGVGKHFDILEFRRLGSSGRPVSGSASGPSTGLFPTDANSNDGGQCVPRRGKRIASDQGPGRKLFKLQDGKIIRIRDNLDVSEISASSHVGTK